MMDGKKGPNGPAANLVAQILRPVKNALNNKVGTKIISTEEACHHFETFNTEVLNRTGPRRQPRRANKAPPPFQNVTYIVGSMDVKGLYPSCKAEKSAQNVQKAFKMCDLQFQNFDTEFLVKVVSVVNRGRHKIHTNECDIYTYRQGQVPL